MSGKPKRVVVAGHDLKFFRALQQALEESGLFEFRADLWAGHKRHDERQSRELLDWAEIVVCEWCLGNAVWYSKRKRRGQHMLIRFHLQERETPFPRMLKLDAVSKIIFVGPHIEKEAHRRLGIPPPKTCVIPNLLDVKRFDQPKYPGAFFNLGMVGTAPLRKRMDLAVDLLQALKEKDERYTLHIKGAHPASYDWLWARTLERRYYLEQFERINASPHRNSIVFDPQADDVPEWLRCIGFILSPSDFESFHMAVGEGMATGSLPIIWDWEGAREIWGPEYVVQSVSAAAEKIEELRQSPGLERRRREAREYVRERFDTAVIRDAWLELMLPEKAARRPAAFERPAAGDRMLVVVFAIDNWSTFHRREMLEALAEQMQADADFLIVEPGNHYQALLDKQWATPSELQYYSRLEPIQLGLNIFKFRSLSSGFPNGADRPADIDRGLSPKDLLGERIRRMFPDHKRLFWLYKPDLRVRWLRPGDQYVYECYDDYTRQFGTGTPVPQMTMLEQATLPHARASFFTSSKLMEQKGPLTPRPVLAENGVAYQVFARHRRDKKPRDGPARVGYLGNLSDFFDWETMIHAADTLAEVSFHFHGPVDPQAQKDKVEQLQRRPNCHFTGRITREKGARLIPGYDALLIPFVQNPAMDAVNPLKLWEYFATGRPVVSSPMTTLQSLNRVIYFAGTPDEWVRQINAAVVEDSEELRKQRIRLAEEHAWSEITKIHAKVLRDISSSF